MKTIFAAVVVGLMSTAAFGELSWATVNTAAYSGDTSPSATTKDYTAYLCLASTAEQQGVFGSKDVDVVTAYFQNNFTEGKAKLIANASAALDQVEWSDKGAGQYSFTGYVNPGSQSVAEYLGIVLYSSGGEDAVRVFSATADGTKWIGDDSTSRPSGTAGVWATAVPEPTSGLLLLLGFASLALRRKRGIRG